MNLSRFLGKPSEQSEADAKAARIQHHRDKVRNGPRAFRHVSEGRVISGINRAEKARVRRANRKNRQAWMRANRELSTLRGQLECVADPNSICYEAAMLGLFDRYGAIVREGLVELEKAVGEEDDVAELIQVDRFNQKHREAVVGAALEHFRLATGQASA